MRIFTKSLLMALITLLAVPLSSMAETVTYDFAAAAAAAEADVTLTASERSAGSNNMGTALSFANELQDLLQDQFGFFFRDECTVTLSKEEGGLAMKGSKDTYLFAAESEGWRQGDPDLHGQGAFMRQSRCGRRFQH